MKAIEQSGVSPDRGFVTSPGNEKGDSDGLKKRSFAGGRLVIRFSSVTGSSSLKKRRKGEAAQY